MITLNTASLVQHRNFRPFCPERSLEGGVVITERMLQMASMSQIQSHPEISHRASKSACSHVVTASTTRMV